MVDFGFRELGLRRISAWCIAENTASARVLERLGFRQEGACVKTNTSRANGGIQYYTPYWRKSGKCCREIVR